MSQAIIVTGADFTGKGLGRSLRLTSDRTNLMGEFILGRNQATSIFNSAYDGAPNAVAFGTLTYSDHYANPAGANYFRTPIQTAQNMTMLAVVAPGATATSEIYVSSSSGNGSNGYFLAGGLSTTKAGLSTTTSAGATQQVLLVGDQSTPLTDFRAIAGRIGGLSNWSLEIDEFKGGQRVQSNASTATGTRTVDSQVFCIGSIGGSATFNSAKDTAAVLLWHRLLTDQELLDAYLECRTVLGRMGITC